MMNKILYSYFNLARLTTLARKVQRLLVSKFSDHPMISTVLTSMDAKLDISVQSVGSTRKQPLTKVVRVADLKRDNSFLSLRDHIQAGLRRENESYRKACEALWPEFEKNDLKLYNKSDGEETTAVDSLIKDLNKPENQPFLATVHATQWLEELEGDNQAFKVASQQRSAVISTDETVADQEAFDQLKVLLDLLGHVLTALFAMNDPEGIREVVDEVNQYIREANASAKQSKTHTATEEVEGE